jgi:hypothetical protein
VALDEHGAIRRPITVLGKRQPDGSVVAPGPDGAVVATNTLVEADDPNPRGFGSCTVVGPDGKALGKMLPAWLVPPVATALVVLLLAAGGWLTSRALKLKPPTEQEVFFPSDHMFTGLGDQSTNNFLAGADDAYENGRLYLGIKDLHRDSFSVWKPDQNRGLAVFDPAFDLSDPEAQQALLSLCEDLRVAPCAAAGCTRPPRTLAAEGTVSCFLEALKAEHNGTLPTGEAFLPALLRWRDETEAGGEAARMIGLIEGELKYVRIDYEMTLLNGQTPAIVREVYEEHIGFLASSFLPTAPPSLATIFPFTASRAYTWMVTQKRLVDGIFTGFTICFPVAFCVLFLATGSVRVSLFAVLTIALIVGSLLGSCELSGWPLGTGEAIAGTIVIGLAVDYTVHLGHIYTESKQQGRRGKMAEAATVMGVTVLAGGVTTFGCACFMFPCQLTFFSKMATLIGGTIGFSLLYSLLFFMPLCALAGPSGPLLSTGQRLRALARSLRQTKDGGKGGGPRQDPASSTEC